MKVAAGKISNWVIMATAVLVLASFLTACSQPEPIKIVPPDPTETPAPTATPQPIVAYISGHVLEPDVYALEPGSRVKQLVEAAGGFTDEANTAVINLAHPLVDGTHIHIPALGEESAPPPVLNEPTPFQRSGEIPLGSGGGLLNINSAEQNELESLPGIGPVTAKKILDYRQANGSFSRIEEIMNVPGIGEGKFAQIQDFIMVGN